MNFLYLFVLIPLLMMGGVALLKEAKQVKIFMLVGSSIILIASFVLLYLFLQAKAAAPNETMWFRSDLVWYEAFNIKFSVGVDGISVLMVILSSIIVFTGSLVSWSMQEQVKEYFLWFLMLSMGVFGFFITIDLFSMFMFYEVALIPMYLLIGIWGTGRKEYSAMKLTLMLMGGSAFLLLGILGIYFNSSAEGAIRTMNILEIAKVHIPVAAQNIFFPITFLGFGVLGALFPFHTWSPDGHSSAPTAVSMLHAGVLMKLGGYGCFRVAIYLMPEGAQTYTTLFLVLTGISVVYGAFGAIVQKDLKYINAYSSVSHCGLVLFAILMMNKTAMTGAILQMLSHGLNTALFFALIGMIYSRTHTRLISEMGGLMKIMPIISVFWVISGFTSLGLPGLSGFVSEMTIFIGAFQHADMFHRVLTILACSSIVITAVYILRVVGKILFGPVFDQHHLTLTDATWNEKIALVTLTVGIVIIGIAPFFPSNIISDGLTSIIGRL
ncbi:MAG: NADH-quinone oxidoreductase subunit M [Bacteroidales bacterium]